MPGKKIRFSIAEDLIPITPSDDENLPESGLILVLGTAGDVTVLTEKGGEVTLPLEPKEIIPLIVKKIFATGTTATDIHLLTTNTISGELPIQEIIVLIDNEGNILTDENNNILIQ